MNQVLQFQRTQLPKNVKGLQGFSWGLSIQVISSNLHCIQTTTKIIIVFLSEATSKVLSYFHNYFVKLKETSIVL